MCAENEDLKKKLGEAGDVYRKASEFENKVALLSQEIERLNSILEKKNNELGNLQRKLS